MKIHLIDGTYELFRAYFGAPPRRNQSGAEVGAVSGILRSLLLLLRDDDVTHIACAFDHVIESFRNDLFDGYKNSENVEPEILDQFLLAEEAAQALGITVWPMIEFEADDAMATGAALWADHPGINQVVLCSPDKDLAQCVTGNRVVCLDRRRERVLDEAGVRVKFGVHPTSIPDWLALVGDSADGIPGVPRWGAQSTSKILAAYPHLEDIPRSELDWEVQVRGAKSLSSSLLETWDKALFYRNLTTLRTDVPLSENLEDLEWRGVSRAQLGSLCEKIDDPEFLKRIHRWA